MVTYTAAGATLDPEGRYRWTLTRRWAPVRPVHTGTVCWVMLNPSTADGADDDPTIRRCVGYSQSHVERTKDQVVTVYCTTTPCTPVTTGVLHLRGIA